MDFSQEDCPGESAQLLLDHLGLPIRKGMSLSELKVNLGGDIVDETELSTKRVIGDNWHYYVRCTSYATGVYDVWICRKDLADKEADG